MYGETNLGATDEAMLTFFKTPMNKPIFDALKKHVYPQFALQFANNESATKVEEPDTNPGKTKKSEK
jgi:hypothetical protein